VVYGNYPQLTKRQAVVLNTAVWVHKVENLLAKYTRPFYVP
jgi:hypothetical protein